MKFGDKTSEINKIPGRQDFPLLTWLELELGLVGDSILDALFVINSGLLFYFIPTQGESGKKTLKRIGVYSI